MWSTQVSLFGGGGGGGVGGGGGEVGRVKVKSFMYRKTSKQS